MTEEEIDARNRAYGALLADMFTTVKEVPAEFGVISLSNVVTLADGSEYKIIVEPYLGEDDHDGD